MGEYRFDSICAAVSIPATVEHAVLRDGCRERHTFEVRWAVQDVMAVETPVLALSWSKKIVDIQYQWHTACGCNRALRPNFARAEASKISSGCPLHCFYNDAGQNRYTVALDDCVTPIERNLGVREEDSTLDCQIRIPLDRTGKTDSYRVTLWLDETDCRYEEAIGAVVTWWEEKYPPMAVPEAARLPMYSSWYSFHQQVFADQVEAQCARAVEMGMKTVIVDDGWQTDDNSRGYAYCGDWRAVPGKIPDMRAHVDAVHRLGMKYMLWYSVPFIGKCAEVAKRFEGKTLTYIDGLGAYTLDPRYPEVRQYLIDTYLNALREWDLDGFKLDFIDSFRMEKDAPAFREGMDFVVLEDAVHVLMVDVMKALRAVKPDILIEFRQSYIGPVMREFGNMFRVADCPNSTSTNRVGVVDLRLTSGNTAVHSDMLMWNVEDRVENAVCQIQNVLFAVVQISVLLDKIPEEHRRAIAFWTRFMQDEQALLLDAPVRAEAPQMLYPLVRAQKDGRGIAACYERGYVVELSSALEEICVINANSGKELLLRFDGCADWSLRVYNCMGDLVEEKALRGEGLAQVPTPECGFIRLKKA